MSKLARGALLFWICVVVGASDPQEEGKSYLSKVQMQEGVHRLPSGVLIRILQKGHGNRSPGVNDSCRIHYFGRLPSGKQFDSSYDRKSPLTISPSQVIPGWTEVLQMMTEGDKWEVYIPYELAYGARGYPPIIPAYSALFFQIEFLEIVSNSGGRPVEESREELKSKLGTSYDEL